jgi:beta-lactamase class A
MLRKKLLLVLIFCFISKIAFMQTTALESLRINVETKLNITGARFGVAFKDLQTGAVLFINEKENFHAASTMKTPVLIELYNQAALGNFSMTDSLEIRNTFHSIVDRSEFALNVADDSESGLYQHIGEKRTISELAYQMIIQSSNLATNLLIEFLTPLRVMNTMKSIGANDIKVLRGVEDGKAYQQGFNNTTTAFDQLVLYELMAKEKLVSSAASKEMINILLDQRFKDIIPALLPTSVKVAHKTGSITGVQHDAGIILLPGGKKYVLVLLSTFDPTKEKEVIQAMAEVSKMIYDHALNN